MFSHKCLKFTPPKRLNSKYNSYTYKCMIKSIFHLPVDNEMVSAIASAEIYKENDTCRLFR